MPKRQYIRIPCHRCLVLAACKSKPEYLSCKLLGTYLSTNSSTSQYRFRRIESTFNKKIKEFCFLYPKEGDGLPIGVIKWKKDK